MKSRYHGQTGFNHKRQPSLGVVIVNLGTPDAPTASALRHYLAEFLADPRVVEIPALLWRIILHGIILRIRPKKSAHAYAAIWTAQGSPLLVSSQQLTDAISRNLQAQVPGPCHVRLAMRYGQPAITDTLNELQQLGAERLLVLPLYPQYSGATTGSVADAVFACLQRWRWVPELRLLGPYHDQPDYIDALCANILAYRKKQGAGQKLLISFHGMPKATLTAGDPYYCHCHKTARMIAGKLSLANEAWEMAFQSRFGAAAWLQPYVIERLQALPKEGIRRLDIVCPGFANDCLETLEEIAIQGRQTFLEAGGDVMNYIPALNASDVHAQLQTQRILKAASDWPELDANYSSEKAAENQALRHQLAAADGG